MDNEGKHHTRSVAQTQEFLSLTDSDRKPRREPSPTYDEQQQQQLEMDDQDGNRQGQAVIQKPNEILFLLQQLLAKQDLLLDENKELKQEMATQQIIINSLSQAVEAIQENKICQDVSSTKLSSASTTAPLSQSTPHFVMKAETSLKEQAAKQLQSKRINQLLDSTPFSGSTSQEVSDWIDDFSN
ncbi:unnamed protein product, partial [Didymodactylos carnosus]